jgi:SAM-dependent methyltransferase
MVGGSMCSVTCLRFASAQLAAGEIQGRRVLEIGSRSVNGSVRAGIEAHRPAEYVGTDLSHGPGVDVICTVEDIVTKFGPESFDLVVTTEMLEHVRDWRTAISNLKRVCRPGGTILITTRSIGFPYHGFPYDYWRYEQSDIRALFADCEVQALESDPEFPGVFVKVRRAARLEEVDLSHHALHSIVLGRRALDISDRDLGWLSLLPVRARGALTLRAFQVRQLLSL